MEFSDNETSSARSHRRAYANPHEAKSSSLTSPQMPTPMSANSLTNAARFNEIYTMAMLGGKSLSDKFNPILANNNNNDYPLQNLNPLYYIQQLSQLNASNGASTFDKHKAKTEEEKVFGNGGGDYAGVEQILKDFHQTFEQNVAHDANFPNEDDKMVNSSSPNGFFRTQSDDSSRVVHRRKKSAEGLALAGLVPSMFPGEEVEEREFSSRGPRAIEPRFLPQSLKWTVLDGDQLENTVFRTFSNSSALIEKLDLSPFESLLDRSNAFLTDSQAKAISQVRERIGLKSFEIMFAVHRLDLQVLKPENVRLVMSIAPTDVDIRRFSAYEQSNSVTSLNDDEQFILQLSKIDRLKEKLAVMDFMGSFGERLHGVNQQISDLMTAAKTLQNSLEFHTILHLLLTCGNLIIGDFNAQLVEGFKPSRILDMCAFQFPRFDGETDEKLTLLDVLAAIIAKSFAYLDRFCDTGKIMEDASKAEFAAILRQLQYFESGIRLIEAELQSSGPNPVLSTFLSQYETETAQCKEIVQLAKDKIVNMLQFFGEISAEEDLHEFQPENFFAIIAQFATLLEAAILGAYSPASRRSSSAAQAMALISA